MEDNNTSDAKALASQATKNFLKKQVKFAESWEVLFAAAALWTRHEAEIARQHSFFAKLAKEDAALILHQALFIRNAPSNVVVALIRMFPQAAGSTDEWGELPLRVALDNWYYIDNEEDVDDSGFLEVIDALVEAYPEALCEKWAKSYDPPLLHVVCSQKGVRFRLIQILLKFCPDEAYEVDMNDQLPIHRYYRLHPPQIVAGNVLKWNIDINILREFIKYYPEGVNCLICENFFFLDDMEKEYHYKQCYDLFEVVISHVATLSDEYHNQRDVLASVQSFDAITTTTDMIDSHKEAHEIIAFLFDHSLSIHGPNDNYKRFITWEKNLHQNDLNNTEFCRCTILDEALRKDVRKEAIEKILKVYPHHIQMVDAQGQLPLFHFIERFREFPKYPHYFSHLNIAKLLLKTYPAAASSEGYGCHRLLLFPFACLMSSKAFVIFPTLSYEELTGKKIDNTNEDTKLKMKKEVAFVAKIVERDTVEFLFLLLKYNPNAIHASTFKISDKREHNTSSAKRQKTCC